MFKRYIWLAVATVFFVCHLFVGSASALELDEAIRTVPLNETGETAVLSQEQVKEGKRLFNYACGTCHAGGVTKTNPNIGLSPEALALATPSRNSVEGIVDYLKNPTTYDGEVSIAEIHPSTQSADLFPKMRNLSEEDLEAIAGHVLLQPAVIGEMWGGGKAYN